MGIQGLLPLLKSIQKPTHLRNFAGQTLGIDAYGWLHRGAVACAIELAQGLPTRKYVDFAMNRVRMLVHFGVKPYVVFDGDYLPSKAHTERDRAARRKETKRVGLELLRAKKHSQAYLELQKAVDVTPLMARELIEELKAAGIPYVVAPYEADSQLAFLEKERIIDGVISEDSDLLVFGVRSLLTKLDQYGECVQIRRDDFTACREVSLVGWAQQEFRMMAILSGCDYLSGIDGMGLKTAYRLVRKHKVIERIVRSLQFDGKKKVPAGYLEDFNKAEQTFLYQWVFSPKEHKLVTLSKVPAELDIATMPYVGRKVEADIAAGVASGNLDPNTKEPLKFIARPPLSARRLMTVETPNEKPAGKPISEFFKPRRIPLAELNPNSFTPSPSQRRLLEDQQNLSWSASQISSMRPPAVTRTASNPALHSAPQPLRRTVSEQVNTFGSTRASPKRQRLCSNKALAASMNGSVGLEDSTSRFFGPSPTLRKTLSKKDDFDLWSDDSAADAVAALANTPVQKRPSPRKRKLQVFNDQARDSQADEGDTSQDTTVASFAESESQSTQGIGTPATSFGSGDVPSVFSKGVTASFDKLKEKWAYKPGASTQSARRTASALFEPALRRSTELPSQEEPVPAAADAAKEREDFVPESSPPIDAEDPPNTADEARADAGEDELLDDEEWLALESQPAKLGEGLKGSEDLLVPESPHSCSEEDEGEQRVRPKPDFGRFAFAGA